MRSWRVGLGLALTSLLLPGVIAAQGNSDDPGSPGLDIKQMSSNAKGFIDEMKQKLQDAFGEYKSISSAKEVAVQDLECINQKLGAMKGLMRLAEQAYLVLQEKAAQSDAQGVDTQYIKISLARDKMETLHGEAMSCAGGGAHHTGETETEVEADEEVEDFNEDNAGGKKDSEPPSYDKPVEASGDGDDAGD